MTKLNDLQLILLAAAAQREDGSLLPPPDHLADQAARIRKVIPPLIKQGLVEEATTTDHVKSWREDGDERFALFITDAGRMSIGIDDQAGQEAKSSASPPPAATPTPSLSKTDNVLTLLRREQGASMDELVAATGWLPHSTRAALTGLRKKGHAITLDKNGERPCYRVVDGAVA